MVPAGHIAEDAVIEERLLAATHINAEPGDTGRVMVDHHDAWAAKPLGLVHQQVAALVVHVIGNDEALWGDKRGCWGEMARPPQFSQVGASERE